MSFMASRSWARVGVGRQVEHLAQRIEFEHVVMVPRTGGRAGAKVVSAADSRRSGDSTFGEEASLGDPARLCGNVPRQPVEHVVGTGERDVQVMEDDREADRSVRDVRKRKSRPNVTATTRVPFRNDSAILEGVGRHEQGRNQAATAPTTRLSGGISTQRAQPGNHGED
jgi:hypothetical protein